MRQRIAVIGTGLIGGSLGLAIKEAKLDVEVVGHDKSLDVAGQAKKRGAVDRTEWNLLNAVDGASLVIIATPVMAVKATMEAIASVLQPGTIVSDTASTKQQVIAWAEQILPAGVHFIGGHPLAGKGASGIASADAGLFKGTVYCLIPAAGAGSQGLDTMVNLVQLVGARAFFLDAAEHDAFMAAVAHLPYLAEAALVRATTASQSWREMRRLAAADYEEASRLLAAEAQTYYDICQTNRAGIARWIGAYIEHLMELKALIEAGSADLLPALQEATAARETWLRTRDRDVEDLGATASVDMAGSQLRQMFLGSLGTRREPFSDRRR